MKKISLIAILALISMLFFVSCGSDDEDAADTETGDTTADTTADTQSDTDADTTDSGADTATDTDADTTADTTADPTDDPTNPTDDPTDPTDDPTNPTDDPTDNPTDNPTDDPTNPTDDPTDPTDDPTNPGETDPGNEGSGPRPANGAVGSTCASEDDCTLTYGSGDNEQIMVCATASDGFTSDGYCTFMCDMTDHKACDNYGGVYVALGSWGDGLCYTRCTSGADCGSGYLCYNSACMPDCVAAGGTCFYGSSVCDTTKRVCVKG